MKIHYVALFVVFLALLLLSGCTQQSMHRSYTSEVYGFSLNPPEGWQQIENMLPSVAIWFAPGNTSNVSLLVDVPFSLSEGRALSTFADQVEENLSERGLNYTIISRDWLTIPGVQAYEIVYSFMQNGTWWETKQVAVLKTRTVFLVTFIASRDSYSQYVSAVNQSIMSFS
jgi:hypothetical protein